MDKLEDQAWDMYEECKPSLSPAQANWCISLLVKNNQNSYKAVIAQLTKVKESKKQ